MKPILKTFGRNFTLCKLCKTHKAIIRKYNLNVCRKCMKDNAKNLGWFL